MKKIILVLSLVLTSSIAWGEGVNTGGGSTGGIFTKKTLANMTLDGSAFWPDGDVEDRSIAIESFGHDSFMNHAIMENLGLVFNLYNHSIVGINFVNENFLTVEEIQDTLEQNHRFRPLDKIKSLRLENGETIDASVLWDIIRLSNNYTFWNHYNKNTPFESNGFSSYVKPIDQNLPLYQENSVVFESLNQLDRTTGIEGGGDDVPHPIIRQYKNYLKQYGDGEFIIHENSTNANDNNIYRNFIDKNRDMINQEHLKKLMDYWQTDLTSPAQYPRYRSHNTKNLNWGIVEDDIKNSLELLDMSGTLHKEADYNALAYKYGKRIYLNSYRDIAEVWFTDNTYLDASEIRESLESPAMVDLDINHIQSIILKDGREIFMDYPDALKELSIRPASNNIDWVLE